MDVRSLTKEAWVKSIPEKMPNGTINIHVRHVVLFRECPTALLSTEGQSFFQVQNVYILPEWQELLQERCHAFQH